MVQSIDNALITQFSDRVHHEAQQLTARLKPHVILKQMSGDLWAYDGIGQVEAREITGRNVPADFDDIEHKRRKISRKRFVINLPVDSSDVRGAIQDPDSEYAFEIASGMVRQMDRVIAAAAFADVFTGRDFESTTTFANDGGTIVDATAGLTYEKLLEIGENFMDDEVGNEVEELMYLTITGKENTSLMKETELTSGDFIRQLVVDGGKMKTAAGFKMIPFGANKPDPILEVTGGERFLMAANNRAICVGMSKDISIKVEERRDLIETHQIQAVLEMGAVRTEGALIQKVRVTA